MDSRDDEDRRGKPTGDLIPILLVPDGLKEYITWKLGTLVSVVRQHIRISIEQLCLALNDEFRTYLPVILPCCIQVLSDAERCSDYTYVHDILHTLEVFVVVIINRNLSFPETADDFHDIKHGTGDEILKKTEKFKFFDRATIIRNTDSSNSCALFIGYVIDSCIIRFL
ncbi:hypothetical protein POM88_039852 [Heracleum sosnowskyi]|uniref:Uncharacterized protein n=1 Tax=Heracleum sosnowskyi TaxID=360622 RepID=A0AAD8M868_9APIA|nr:hypothetical protein POM88_039852 [Heracleum sosnowskyi]